MKGSEKKTNKQLRRFGLVMTIPLVLLGALFLWKGKAAAPWLCGAAGFFLLSGLIVPRILAPIEMVWRVFARVLNVVVTFIILTILFYLVITPFGLVLRLFGKELIPKRFDAAKSSYWIKVDPDGPCSRPDKPY